MDDHMCWAMIGSCLFPVSWPLYEGTRLWRLGSSFAGISPPEGSIYLSKYLNYSDIFLIYTFHIEVPSSENTSHVKQYFYLEAVPCNLEMTLMYSAVPSTPFARISQESDREKFTHRIILQIITNLVQLTTKVGV